MVWRCSRRSVFGADFVQFMLGKDVPNLLGKVMVDGLSPITALGFLKDMSEELITDVRKHVVGSPRLSVIARNESAEELEPVAFVASSTQNVSIYQPNDMNLYDLGGIIIAPAYQGRGLGKTMVRRELSETYADLLGFQTQNLHMLALGSTLAEYDFTLSCALAETLGSQITRIQKLGDRLSVVEPERYRGQSLYGDVSEYRRQGMTIQDLNYQNGDAVIFVGRVRSGI